MYHSYLYVVEIRLDVVVLNVLLACCEVWLTLACIKSALALGFVDSVDNERLKESGCW